MKRKILFLVGLLILVGVVIGSVKVLGNRSAKQGVLKVNSNPSASIFLDNKHLGRTPFEDKVNSGEYTIKIVPESTVATLVSWEGKITVGGNTLTYVNRDLSESELTSAGEVLWLEKISSRQSELSVTTTPDGATVLLDDVTKGTTPVTIPNITPGDHGLSVVSPGFLTRTLKIKTTGGYKLSASIQLALSPGSSQPTASPSATPATTPSVTVKPTPTKTATSSGQFPDPPKPFAIIKDTPTGYLRVRMEPSTSASEAGRVKPGEKYTILDTKSGWYQITYDGTNAGWVSGQYAEKVE